MTAGAWLTPLAVALYNNEKKAPLLSFLFPIKEFDECGNRKQTFYLAKAAILFVDATIRWPDKHPEDVRDSLVKWIEGGKKGA